MTTKKLVALALLTAAVTGGAGYKIHDLVWTNEIWQTQWRPRVQMRIALLKASGVDTTEAERLCLRRFMTLSGGNACLGELEAETQKLP